MVILTQGTYVTRAVSGTPLGGRTPLECSVQQAKVLINQGLAEGASAPFVLLVVLFVTLVYDSAITHIKGESHGNGHLQNHQRG